jgi:hypothetical protein
MAVRGRKLLTRAISAMDEQEWAKRLRAGIGGRNLWRLRRKAAVATARDLVAVGQKMAGGNPNEKTLDSVDAIGFLLQMTGELMFASANLLSKGEFYAGAALLRQVTEIEYLTWAIKENHRTAENWLQSTHEERMSLFAPVQLRRTSRGRFLDKDYRDHCELGGHPTLRGIALLGGKELGVAQGNLVDLLTHCWRIWDQVTAWSANFPRARRVVAQSHSQISGRLNDWGKQDPIYKAMAEQRPDIATA